MSINVTQFSFINKTLVKTNNWFDKCEWERKTLHADNIVEGERRDMCVGNSQFSKACIWK